MIVQQFNQPEFTTHDASLGVSKDNWNVELLGLNISDPRGFTFISASEAIQTQTVIRPRVRGLKAGWKF
jgi:iron complex outermembrane receptor protein